VAHTLSSIIILIIPVCHYYNMFIELKTRRGCTTYLYCVPIPLPPPSNSTDGCSMWARVWVYNIGIGNTENRSDRPKCNDVYLSSQSFDTVFAISNTIMSYIIRVTTHTGGTLHNIIHLYRYAPCTCILCTDRITVHYFVMLDLL